MVAGAKRNRHRCPTHPGALLREDVIPATGKTKAEIARLLGILRQHLYDVLRERKPVSPAIAVRLGKLFGDGAGSGYACRRLTIPGTRNAKRM
jgi:antitoxin HigA-1